MKKLVVDASVIVKWVLPDRIEEQKTDKALSILQRVRASEITVHQPPHWLAEVSGVLTRLSPETVVDDIVDLYDMNFDVCETLELYIKASELASELDHHLFDTLYHAVAVTMTDTVLITDDHRYFRKAERIGHIELL